MKRTAMLWIRGTETIMRGYLSQGRGGTPKAEEIKAGPLLDFLNGADWQFVSSSAVVVPMLDFDGSTRPVPVTVAVLERTTD